MSLQDHLRVINMASPGSLMFIRQAADEIDRLTRELEAKTKECEQERARFEMACDRSGDKGLFMECLRRFPT